MSIYNHIKWPSFENIHRLLNHKCLPRDILVTVTEKIDGCNFSVEIHGGKIVSFNSRNHNLWNVNSKQDPPKSFNKNQLDFLRKSESKYLNLCKAINLGENQSLILFGELFQSKLFPFAYATRNLDNPDMILCYTMTSHLWELFNSLDLNPPKLFFGRDLMLTEAISGLHELMMDPPSGFEGVFITYQNDPSMSHEPRYISKVLGMKYKTVEYEEQKSWYIQEEDTPEVFKETVCLLKEVFASKPQSEVKTKRSPKSEPKYKRDIILAFKSVNSKVGITKEIFSKLGPEDKRDTVYKLNEEVFKDIISQSPIEEDLELLKKEVNSIVPKLILDN